MVLEKTLESPLDCKEIQPVYPKGDQSWVFIGRTDAEAETPNILATWCEELTHLKRPWCWERLKAGGGEGDNREWDGWMVSLTQWTWVWVNSSSWWWTGRPSVLQSVGSQRVRHYQPTELNWTEPPHGRELQMEKTIFQNVRIFWWPFKSLSSWFFIFLFLITCPIIWKYPVFIVWTTPADTTTGKFGSEKYYSYSSRTEIN